MFTFFWQKQKNNDLADRFTKVYTDNLWGDDESRSGPGSRLDSGCVQASIEALAEIVDQYQIQSIADIPCGDFNWMYRLLEQYPHINYQGFDIVEPLVKENQRKYPHYSFKTLNICRNVPPKVDLIFCKDLVNHLTHTDCMKALLNMKKSGSYYLLISNNFGYENKELSMNKGGCSRHLDLMLAPFNFPEPVWHTSYLSLWRISDLPKGYQ